LKTAHSVGVQEGAQGLKDGLLFPSGLCGVVEHRSLAISTGSFQPSPTREAVHRIAKLGFKHVEVTVQDSELNYDFYRRTDMDYFEELRSLVHELGLRVTSLHAPQLSAVQTFSSKASHEIMTRFLEIASLFQGDLLVVHPYHIFRSYEVACSFLSDDSPGTGNFMVPEFPSVLANAKENGLRIAIENIAHWHDHPLLNEPRNMLKLVSSLDSETVGVDLDIFHSELGGTTFEFLDKLRDHILSLHLCDFGDSRNRTLPGKGRVNWEKLAGLIGNLEKLDCIVMEVAGQFEDEELGNSAGYLRGVFGLEP